MNPTAPRWLIEEVCRAKKGSDNEKIRYTRNLLARLEQPTVCESAGCPNRGECFSHHTATFLIMGDVCTRNCSFCAVQHGRPSAPPDENEPERVARAVTELGLSHVVITSVTRDDLPDGGAAHYASVVRALRYHCPDVRVEILVPDFEGSEIALATALAAWPDILAHNIETVPRLYPQVRRGADYARSLALLRRSRIMSPGTIIKSSLMLGLGEQDSEVQSVLSDLAATGCAILTIGQYLAPSLVHAQVVRYVSPREFGNWREKALQMGFRSVAAGPLIRSSYKAPALWEELR